MIVLDTNVVSQFLRPDGSEAVLRWLDAQEVSSFRITSITVMEIRLGIELMPEGKKRSSFDREWANVLGEYFVDNVLTFDKKAAEIAGRLSAQRFRQGLNIDNGDTQIAAISIANDATLATRNIRHFHDTPPDLVNPWVAGIRTK